MSGPAARTHAHRLRAVLVARRAPHARLRRARNAEGVWHAAPVRRARGPRRAPYQWTPATRSRSAFIHGGRVNGVRAGRPRSAGVAHVREEMARRRGGGRRRAKSAARTSVVRRAACTAAWARRLGATRQPAGHFLRAESRAAFAPHRGTVLAMPQLDARHALP
ncbi:unnamed protein product, partial [Iphiclides podalirius]